MDLRIKGKAALVTGGSRGIGRETVRRFLEEGARVFTCARNEEALAETCAGLAAETGGEIHYTVADTSNAAELAPLVERAREKLGSIDILVNNAGTMSSGRFEVLDDAALQKQLDTKLFGFLRLIRLVEPGMRAEGVGAHREHDWGCGKRAGPLYVRQRHDEQRALEHDEITLHRIRRGGYSRERGVSRLGGHRALENERGGSRRRTGDGLGRRGTPPRGAQKRAGPFR